MTFLENLWYGNINPHEKLLSGNSNFKHLLHLTGKNRDKLTDIFTKPQRETLEQYGEMYPYAEQAAFKYGFALNVRLIMKSVFIKSNKSE